MPAKQKDPLKAVSERHYDDYILSPVFFIFADFDIFFLLILLPPALFLSLPKASSICRIGCVPLGLFLAGKVSHGHAIPLDGPPTFRRPMRSGLDRHHLIDFVGIVVAHFFAFSPNSTSLRLAISEHMPVVFERAHLILQPALLRKLVRGRLP
jgi:hypothetical protein